MKYVIKTKYTTIYEYSLNITPELCEMIDKTIHIYAVAPDSIPTITMDMVRAAIFNKYPVTDISDADRAYYEGISDISYLAFICEKPQKSTVFNDILYFLDELTLEENPTELEFVSENVVDCYTRDFLDASDMIDNYDKYEQESLFND